MNDSQVRKMDKLDREDAFITDNIADFAGFSSVSELTQQINAERQNILQFDAEQTSGFSAKRQAQEIYENRRDALIDLLDKFVLAAAIVDDEIEGTAAQFKNPYPRTNQKLIARATSFSANSANIQAQLRDAGLDAGDFALLLTLRNEFQQAAAAHDSAEEHHAEATGGMVASFRNAMALSARRDKRVRMKYRDNPAKLAAWVVASHLDRSPKRKKNNQNPPS